MKDLKFAEIVKRNRELKSYVSGKPYRVVLFGNITLNPLKEILEYSLRSLGLNAEVDIADFDNFLQAAPKFSEHDLGIVFWEAANLTPGFHAHVETFEPERLRDLLEKQERELLHFVELTSKLPRVLFNSFSGLLFSHHSVLPNALDRTVDGLNSVLKNILTNNLTLIPLDKIISRTGVNQSFNPQHFYNSQTLYTLDFFKEYACHILPTIRAASGRSKKALILDCDNTLWGGVLGEAGFDGIKMSGDDSAGMPYREVQLMVNALGASGVIIGICSKNNPEDVERVLKEHRDLALDPNVVVIKRVNWTDKATNLQDIAENLNIGLDSIVFVDDSDFEINLVRELLPAVHTVRVPDQRFAFPALIREVSNLFFKFAHTKEDQKKIEMYKAEAVRTDVRAKYTNIGEYIADLNLVITVATNDRKNISRLSQLTQKTNQFNLTTRRYSEVEIETFMNSPNHSVFSFGAKDKFGDYGTIGLMITEVDSQRECARIDSFLMSCRAMGRKIEQAFFDHIVRKLKDRSLKNLTAEMIPTTKNIPVRELYSDLGLNIVAHEKEKTVYSLNFAKYVENKLDFIEVKIDGTS